MPGLGIEPMTAKSEVRRPTAWVIVSKAKNVTPRALYKLRGGIRDGEQMSLKMGRWDWKTATEGEEVTCWGRLFQTQAAATGKDRSLTVDSESTADNQWWRHGRTKSLTSATWQSSSTRYDGAHLWRHLYTRIALKAIHCGAFRDKQTPDFLINSILLVEWSDVCVINVCRVVRDQVTKIMCLNCVCMS